MGRFKVDIKIARPVPKPNFIPVPEVLVDTGSEIAWILESVLRAAGVLVRKKDQSFLMANGRQISRPAARQEQRPRVLTAG